MESLESDYDDIAPSHEKIERLIEEESILQQQKIQQNQMAIQKEQALIQRENEVAAAELQLKAQELELKATQIEINQQIDNRELDIRQNRYTQQVSADIIKAREEMDARQAKPGGAEGNNQPS